MIHLIAAVELALGLFFAPGIFYNDAPVAALSVEAP